MAEEHFLFCIWKAKVSQFHMIKIGCLFILCLKGLTTRLIFQIQKEKFFRWKTKNVSITHKGAVVFKFTVMTVCRSSILCELWSAMICHISIKVPQICILIFGGCDVRTEDPHYHPCWRHIQRMGLQVDKLHQGLSAEVVCPEQWAFVILQVCFFADITKEGYNLCYYAR